MVAISLVVLVGVSILHGNSSLKGQKQQGRTLIQLGTCILHIQQNMLLDVLSNAHTHYLFNFLTLLPNTMVYVCSTFTIVLTFWTYFMTCRLTGFAVWHQLG